MSIVSRIAKLSALVVLGLAATGCIVLPYGACQHGRRDRDNGHYAPPADGHQPYSNEAPRERPGRGGR